MVSRGLWGKVRIAGRRIKTKAGTVPDDSKSITEATEEQGNNITTREQVRYFFNCFLIILEIQKFSVAAIKRSCDNSKLPRAIRQQIQSFLSGHQAQLATTLSKLLTCFSCSFSYFFKLVSANHYRLTLKQRSEWVIISARTALFIRQPQTKQQSDPHLRGLGRASKTCGQKLRWKRQRMSYGPSLQPQ